MPPGRPPTATVPAGHGRNSLPTAPRLGRVAAADLYRPQLENDLQRPNTRLYPGIAATLATMAETV